MSEPIRVEKHKKHIIKVYQDDMAESPREWDNLGTMVCFHSRYDLGDKHELTVENTKSLVKGRDTIALPLYLYDHSGITMNTTGFHCPWDSGQVGWILVKRERVRKEFEKKRISKKLLDKVIEILRSEVGIYDSYIKGNVFGYEIVEETGGDGDSVDSCWGYFSYEHMLEDAKNVIENL